MNHPFAMLRRLGLPLLILAVAVAGFALLVATRPQTHRLQAHEKAWPVAVLKATPGRWPRVLTLFGRVDALARSRMASALAADVVQVAVSEGQPVRRGDLLVQLDDRDFRLDLQQRQAEVDQARAAIEAERSAHQANLAALPGEKRLLELAQAQVRRRQDLMGRKLSSQAELDQAREAQARQAIAVTRIEEKVRTHASRVRELKARLAQRQAALEKARLQLARTRITAPFDGRVVVVQVAAGQRVNPGTPLLELFDRRSLVFRAQVPEPWVGELRRALAGDRPVTARAQLEGRTVEARLLRFAARIPARAGAPEALLRVTRGQAGLVLDQVVALQLQLPPVEGVVPIPPEALYGADRVWRVDENQRLHPLQVERLGETVIEGRTRLLVRIPGLQAGDRLLATQLPNAVEGLLVKVVDGG